MAHTYDPSPHRRALKLAAPFMTGALVLGAASCTKKAEDVTATATTSTVAGGAAGAGTSTAKPGSGSGSTGTTADGSGGTTGTTRAPDGTVNLKKTVWINGFKVTFGEETYDAKTGELSFALEAENLQTSSGYFQPQFTLELDGTQLQTGTIRDAKNILAGNKVKEVLVFPSMGAKFTNKFDPAKTTLVIGKSSERQARIKIDGTGGDTDVTNMPIDQDFKADVVIGLVTLSVTKTQVRFDDLPYEGTQVDKGKVYVVMTGAWRNNSDTDTMYWNSQEIILTSADGTQNRATNFGTDTSLGSKKKNDKMHVIFLLDAKDGKFGGDYTLDLKQPFGASAAEVTQSVKLTLSEKAMASTTTTTAK